MTSTLYENVASVYVVQRERILFIWHKKFQKWLAPGGHALPDEMPHHTACRECEEETGLQPQLLCFLPFEYAHACALPTPIAMVEALPPPGDNGPKHLDHIFAAKKTAGIQHSGQWLDLATIDAYATQEKIFPETAALCQWLLNRSIL